MSKGKRRPKSQPVQSPRNAWLEMLRPPNLLTVPGDPLAGYCLALAAVFGPAGAAIGTPANGAAATPAVAEIVLAALASVLIYMAGLLQNDYFDQGVDRQERPGRPLPSGRANPRTVVLVALVLAVAGIVAASFASVYSGVAATVLVVVMTLYNSGGKKGPLAGPLLMGACRGLSVLIGAGLLGDALLLADANSAIVLAGAIGVTLYIAAVTAIAARETLAGDVGMQRRFPSLVAAILLAGLLLLQPQHSMQFWMINVAMSTVAVVYIAWCGRQLAGRPTPGMIQRSIGKFIVAMLFLQAALAVHVEMPGLFIAAGLLAAFPVSRRLGKWFYAS